MFGNFTVKKIAAILGIILTSITIIVTVKSCLSSKDENSKPNVSNSGDNSNVINGNGNTINNNRFEIPQESKQIDAKKPTVKSTEINFNPAESNKLNIGKTTIAIIPFENLSGDKKHEWLSKGIAETLLEPISNNEKYTVIEGTLRDKVINEITFQQGKYVDIKTAVKIGKMIGANQIITGSYQIVDEKIKITSRIIEVQTSRVIKNSIIDYEDSVLDPLKMEKNYSIYFMNKINL